MKLNIIILGVLASVWLLPLSANCQNNTSSPYSAFGIGDLANVAYGRNLALGGAGLGIRDPYLLNLKNPASLTTIDSMNFLFEMGVSVQRTFTYSIDHDEKYWDGNLTHIAAAHRYTRFLMGCYGLMPYTNVGYRLRTSKHVEGDDSYTFTDREGSGGVNKLFYSLGVKFSDHFSLGGELAYYYGPIIESRKTYTLVASDNPTYYNLTNRYHGVSFKAGTQYSLNLNDKGSNLTLGAFFSTGQKLWIVNEILIQQQYGSSAVDSIYYDLDDETSMFVPMSYGAGMGLTLKGKYLLAADVEMSDWSRVNKSKSYLNQMVYSVGFEFLPQKKLDYFSRCAYRFGYRYDTGYIQAKGYDINDIRLSVGMGLPIQKTASMINVALEAGQRGTERMGLIRERYYKMTVSFSLQDLWFVPRKLN